VALHLKSILDSDEQLRNELYCPDTPSRFFVSDLPSPVQALAIAIFGRPVLLEKTDV